jgi:hypothetical protein
MWFMRISLFTSPLASTSAAATNEIDEEDEKKTIERQKF